MHQAIDVAKAILQRGGREEDNDLSNLKLQKLLYYVQGFTLALKGEPCFSDPIVAWPHGPVVESVYQAYKEHGPNLIPPPTDFDPSVIGEGAMEIIDEVFETYGQFSAWRLREMTHEEAPWLSTPRNHEISLDKMQSFFRTRLRDG